MNSRQKKNSRIFIAVGIALGLILFYFVFFAFQLAVAMQIEAFVSKTKQVMTLGLTLALYVVYRRVKDADKNRARIATSAEVLTDIVVICLFVTSWFGLMFPLGQVAARWANVVISFCVLVGYSVSGTDTIKRMINLYKLK